MTLQHLQNNGQKGLPMATKLDSWLVLGYEKLARENELTIEEVREATITIKGGEISVKTKGKK